MPNINTGGDLRTHALIVSPKGGKSAEVAAYTIDDGSTLIANANIRPFSFLDGSHLQRMNANTAELSATYIKDHMVSVGHCESCDNDIIATASLADAIETANDEIHCPMCSANVKPAINNSKLINALASEYEEDAEEDDKDDKDCDKDEKDCDDEEMASAVDSLKKKMAEMSNDEDEGDPDDADVVDDEDYGDDSGDDSEGEGDDEGTDDEDYIPDDTIDEDGGDGEEGDDEDYTGDDDADSDSAESDEGNDGDMNDDDADQDGGVPYDDVYDDDDMEQATAAFKKVVAHKLGQLPVAGKGVDRPDIEGMNERARDLVRDRRSGKTDGNAYMKGANAVAKELTKEKAAEKVEDKKTEKVEAKVEEKTTEKAADAGQEKTPGTNDVTGEMNKQVETPGTEEKKPGNMTTQEKTPGTEVSGDIIIDWTNSKIELVATADKDNIWVFANNVPVGKIVKEKASTGIQARWNEQAGLQSAFVAVAKRGFTVAEASEFGFEAQSFKVEGEQVIRNAMHRQAMLATENAKKEIANGVDRYKQSVRSAMVAAFKGIYNDLPNDFRDQLITSLASISVAEPRSIVDSAFAKSAEKLLVAVFTKADEIAGKSNEVRNEIASFVAGANYQSRINESTEFAAKLAANNGKMVAAGMPDVKTNSAGDSNWNDRIRNAIHSIK